MPDDHSFDIVAEVNFAEVQNAHQTSLKQIANRYDFKGRVAQLEFNKGEKKVVCTGSNDYIVEQMTTIFFQQLGKRNVDLNAFQKATSSPAAGGTVRVTYDIRDTLSTDECKQVLKAIKDAKLKRVKATNQGDSVRVTGPSKDELQAVQTLVRELKLPCPIRFTNYK